MAQRVTVSELQAMQRGDDIEPNSDAEATARLKALGYGEANVRDAEILKAAGVGSQLELLLLNRLERAGLPLGEAQVLGIPGRKFAFDRAWRAEKVAVDCNGATFVKGGHSTGRGIERDAEKACLAAVNGWLYLPITKHMIEDGRAVDIIAMALTVRRRKL